MSFGNYPMNGLRLIHHQGKTRMAFEQGTQRVDPLHLAYL